MQTIGRDALRRAMASDRDFVLIDVLGEESYEAKHIDGAYNIPLHADDFLAQVKSCVRSKLDPIVVYCAGYECDASRRAAQKLKEAGYSHVRAYEGGIEDWEDAGLPVASGPDRHHRYVA